MVLTSCCVESSVPQHPSRISLPPFPQLCGKLPHYNGLIQTLWVECSFLLGPRLLQGFTIKSTTCYFTEGYLKKNCYVRKYDLAFQPVKKKKPKGLFLIWTSSLLFFFLTKKTNKKPSFIWFTLQGKDIWDLSWFRSSTNSLGISQLNGSCLVWFRFKHKT